jgi:hypothetical protein
MEEKMKRLKHIWIIELVGDDGVWFWGYRKEDVIFKLRELKEDRPNFKFKIVKFVPEVKK